MNEKLSVIEKVGGIVSTLLLGKTKELIVRTDERVHHLNEKVQHLTKSVDEVKVCMDDFRTSIAIHGAHISALQIHTKYGVSKSPTLPNTLGQKLLKDSTFNTIYPQLKTKLFALMDSKNLRTLYDYEKGAQWALKELQGDPLMDSIKEYSVNHPDTSLELVFEIASWVIRDAYAQYKKMELDFAP